jgi:hypothetical protein
MSCWNMIRPRPSADASQRLTQCVISSSSPAAPGIRGEVQGRAVESRLGRRAVAPAENPIRPGEGRCGVSETLARSVALGPAYLVIDAA